MSIIFIDKFVQFIKNSIDASEKIETTESNSGTYKIHRALDRVMDNKDVSDPMKQYATKLVDTYLPAIYCTYMASEGSADNVTARINKDIDKVRDNILTSIEACLIDIEHGAVFDDNLNNPFINCLLSFEQIIDDRVPKN